METIIDFFNIGIDSLNGFGDALESWMERFIFWLLIAYLKSKLWTLEFSYSIASFLIQNLGVSAFIESAWNNIDSTVLAAMTYLRIPEGLNIIVSAALTRFIMDLIP